MKKLLFSISITLLSGLFALCNPVDRIENRSENDHKLANSLFDNQKAYVNNSTKSASELENIYAKNKKKGKATDCALNKLGKWINVFFPNVYHARGTTKCNSHSDRSKFRKPGLGGWQSCG